MDSDINIDALLEQNSLGRLSDIDRWSLKYNIEESPDSKICCLSCEKHDYDPPSKALDGSRYCRGHLRYALATGINPGQYLSSHASRLFKDF